MNQTKSVRDGQLGLDDGEIMDTIGMQTWIFAS